MNWISEIEAFTPCSEQEARDKEIILKYSRTHAGTVLLRSDPIAHCTSSAFILNKEQTKVLMIFHKIRNS